MFEVNASQNVCESLKVTAGGDRLVVNVIACWQHVKGGGGALDQLRQQVTKTTLTQLAGDLVS